MHILVRIRKTTTYSLQVCKNTLHILARMHEQTKCSLEVCKDKFLAIIHETQRILCKFARVPCIFSRECTEITLEFVTAQMHYRERKRAEKHSRLQKHKKVNAYSRENARTCKVFFVSLQGKFSRAYAKTQRIRCKFARVQCICSQERTKTPSVLCKFARINFSREYTKLRTYYLQVCTSAMHILARVHEHVKCSLQACDVFFASLHGYNA